jgi:cell division septal protein FtsQ
MPLVLDRDATILEIDGDQLIILGAHEADLARGSATNREHRHHTPERRTVAVGVATGAETPTSLEVIEHQRFVDRRAAVAEAQQTNRRRRRGKLVAASVVCVGAALAVSASPLLRVNEVRIIGVQSLNQQAVLDAVGASDAPSMLVIKVSDVEARVNALPLVNDARVWKQWPDRLIVEVAERFPVATARSGSGWIILDQRGETLETRQVRPDLPQFDLAGQPIDPTQTAVHDLLLVAISSSPRLRQQIDTLSTSGSGVDIRLRSGVIDNNDLLIRFGHVDDVQAKLRALATMLDPATKAPLDGLSVLDLTVADQPALMPTSTLPAAPPVDSEAAGGLSDELEGAVRQTPESQPN